MFYFQCILLSHSCQKHASVPFQLAALKLKYFIECHDVLCFRRVLLSLMSKVCICPIPNLEWSISTCSWSNTLQKLLFKWCAGIKNLFPPTADRCIIHHWAWKHGRYIFFFPSFFFFLHITVVSQVHLYWLVSCTYGYACRWGEKSTQNMCQS